MRFMILSAQEPRRAQVLCRVLGNIYGDGLWHKTMTSGAHVADAFFLYMMTPYIAVSNVHKFIGW